MTRRVADEVNLEGSSFEGYHQPIKGYEILERIGSGGMGSVYKAKQASLERVVALKVLRKDRMDDPRSLERLHKEARLLARLDHPNIVRSIDMGEMGPYVYFAMELVDGRSVKDVIVENGPLADLAAVRIVEKVALALEYAAAEGITHRDVKPGNILLGRGGVVKLSDFGLAMGPIDTGTRSGTLGTPQYISPEQARHPKRIDVRSDLFSLGSTFYHMVTGQVPFPGDSVAAVITAVLFKAPKPAEDVRPGIHPLTARVLARLMAKNPRLRYQTPRALIADLEILKDVLGGETGATGIDIGLSWKEAGQRELPLWKQPIALGIGLGLLGVVIAAVVIGTHSGSARSNGDPQSQAARGSLALAEEQFATRVRNLPRDDPGALADLLRELDTQLAIEPSDKLKDLRKQEADILRREIGTDVGSSRVDLQACKLEYSIVSPK